MLGNVIRGVVGQIKWAYYSAAAINGYTVTRGKDTRWYLTATVVDCDKFKMSQKPLMFVAHHQEGQWFWPITDYELREGTQLTATLGPPV